MVLKTVGFLSVMISTATAMISIWAFLQSQDNNSNNSMGSSSPGWHSLFVSSTLVRVGTVVTASVALLQLLFSSYLLASKTEDFVSKSKSWIVYTLGGVTVSWATLAGLVLLHGYSQREGERWPQYNDPYYSNLLNSYYHMLAMFSFVHTIEITLLSEFLKFVTGQMSLHVEYQGKA